MTRQCQITGRRVMSGCNVSHALNHSRRTFQVNLQRVRLYSNILNEQVRLRVSPQALKTIDAAGGLDLFILSQSKRKLPLPAQSLKRRIEKRKKAIDAQHPTADS